jgi:hypothetical protein
MSPGGAPNLLQHPVGQAPEANNLDPDEAGQAGGGGQFVFCLKGGLLGHQQDQRVSLRAFPEFFPHLVQAGAGFSGTGPAGDKAYSHGLHLHFDQIFIKRHHLT